MNPLETVFAYHWNLRALIVIILLGTSIFLLSIVTKDWKIPFGTVVFWYFVGVATALGIYLIYSPQTLGAQPGIAAFFPSSIWLGIWIAGCTMGLLVQVLIVQMGVGAPNMALSFIIPALGPVAAFIAIGMYQSGKFDWITLGLLLAVMVFGGAALFRLHHITK